MTAYFRVTAKGLIYSDDHVLLIKKPIGVWDLPGGRLDVGEHPEAALQREIREELGIDAEVGQLADCAVRRRPGQVDVFVVTYHCRPDDALDSIRLSEEHTEARLFHVDQVAALPMHDTYKNAIQRGAQGGPALGGALPALANEALEFLSRSKVFQG